MSRRSEKRRRKDEAEPAPLPCPLCDAPLETQARCFACGARVLFRPPTVPAVRIELCGEATAVTAAPVPSTPEVSSREVSSREVSSREVTSREGGSAVSWQHAYDLKLPSGRTVCVLTAEDTELFSAPGIDPARVSGVQAACRGALSEGFSEHQGGVREAAERVDLLRASGLALGPGAEQRLQRGLAHHDLSDAAHSMRTAEEQDSEHSEDLRFSESSIGKDRWDVSVDWAPRSRTSLYMLFLVPGCAAFAAERIGHIGEIAGPSLIYFATIALTAALVLLPVGMALTAFRRTSIKLDASWLRVRDLPMPWPAAREVALPVSELSHLVVRERSLHVVLFDDRQHQLLRWAEEPDDRNFVRRLLERRIELRSREEKDAPAPQPTGLRRLLWRLRFPLLALLLVGLPLSCLTPTCVMATVRPAWVEARRKANACPEVTERLGKDVTWAFGLEDADRLDDGVADLPVKGDRRRGRMILRFAVPMSEGVRLRQVDIEVGGETVCALCCAVYGKDPRHPRR